ncbi:hypothetical protein M432DRAFT_265413 [Thermoascus aurantiacus ATCC 26904]
MPEERRPAHVHGALRAGARGLAARDVHRRARRHLRGQSVFDPQAVVGLPAALPASRARAALPHAALAHRRHRPAAPAASSPTAPSTSPLTAPKPCVSRPRSTRPPRCRRTSPPRFTRPPMPSWPSSSRASPPSPSPPCPNPLPACPQRFGINLPAGPSQQVIAAWWVAVEGTNRLLLTSVWTWNGQLHLGVNYNEAFYERGLCRAVRGGVEGGVGEGVGGSIDQKLRLLCLYKYHFS